MAMVPIETDIDVDVQDCEGASVDFRLDCSHGTVEVTLGGYTCSRSQRDMLVVLENAEIFMGDEVKALLESPALTPDSVLEFIKKQPLDWKFALVKDLLRGE